MSHRDFLRHVVVLAAVVLICVACAVLPGGERAGLAAEPGSGTAWKNGPSKAPGYFPLAVWLQDPKNAPKYQAIGINVFVALWEGPNAQQIAELKKHGMPVICEQNRYALEHLDEPTIIGWMHGDEPDNAQSLPGGKGYGPPILPAKIVEDYQKIKAADPTRPVMLNLGQGVAWDGWYGRGVRTNHPEDYPEYARGGDLISFDIYPAVHDRAEIAGKLWYVPYGVQRLRQWAGGQKVIWDCIECTRISNPKTKPTPAQVKAEVWMSIIHGSKGLIYFCHQFQPSFVEAGLLADAEMSKAVGAINRQIRELAPAINSPSVGNLVTADSNDRRRNPSERGCWAAAQLPRRSSGTTGRPTSSPSAWIPVRRRSTFKFSGTRHRASRSDGRSPRRRPADHREERRLRGRVRAVRGPPLSVVVPPRAGSSTNSRRSPSALAKTAPSPGRSGGWTFVGSRRTCTAWRPDRRDGVRLSPTTVSFDHCGGNIRASRIDRDRPSRRGDHQVHVLHRDRAEQNRIADDQGPGETRPVLKLDLDRTDVRNDVRSLIGRGHLPLLDLGELQLHRDVLRNADRHRSRVHHRGHGHGLQLGFPRIGQPDFRVNHAHSRYPRLLSTRMN